MKLRVLVLTVAISLLLYFSASAAGIDVESMSVDELLELKDSINKRLEELGEANTLLYPGSYVAGRELNPGDYTVALSLDFPNEYGWCYIAVYEDESMAKSLLNRLVEADVPQHVHLDDNNMLFVQDSPVVLKKQ